MSVDAKRRFAAHQMDRLTFLTFALAVGCTPKPGPPADAPIGSPAAAETASPAVAAPATERESRETEEPPAQHLPDWPCELADALEKIRDRCETAERTITPGFAKHVTLRLRVADCDDGPCLSPSISLLGFVPRPPSPSKAWHECMYSEVVALRFTRDMSAAAAAICAQNQVPDGLHGMYLKAPDPIPEDACAVGETSCWQDIPVVARTAASPGS